MKSIKTDAALDLMRIDYASAQKDPIRYSLMRGLGSHSLKNLLFSMPVGGAIGSAIGGCVADGSYVAQSGVLGAFSPFINYALKVMWRDSFGYSKVKNLGWRANKKGIAHGKVEDNLMHHLTNQPHTYIKHFEFTKDFNSLSKHARTNLLVQWGVKEIEKDPKKGLNQISFLVKYLSDRKNKRPKGWRETRNVMKGLMRDYMYSLDVQSLESFKDFFYTCDINKYAGITIGDKAVEDKDFDKARSFYGLAGYKKGLERIRGKFSENGLEEVVEDVVVGKDVVAQPVKDEGSAEETLEEVVAFVDNAGKIFGDLKKRVIDPDPVVYNDVLRTEVYNGEIGPDEEVVDPGVSNSKKDVVAGDWPGKVDYVFKDAPDQRYTYHGDEELIDQRPLEVPDDEIVEEAVSGPATIVGNESQKVSGPVDYVFKEAPDQRYTYHGDEEVVNENSYVPPEPSQEVLEQSELPCSNDSNKYKSAVEEPGIEKVLNPDAMLVDRSGFINRVVNKYDQHRSKPKKTKLIGVKQFEPLSG